MVRQMMSMEQKLSQSQQGSSSQEVLTAPQQSHQVAVEAGAEERAETERPAGWFLDQMEETFNKAGDPNTTAQAVPATKAT